MKNSKIGRLVVALVVCGATVSALASTNYGDFIGTTVIYQDVTESSGTDPGQLFMKDPQIFGDTLDFNPTFTANAANGASKIKDAQVNFDVIAKSGFGIEGLVFTERGDYSLSGSAGTTSTLADVSANFFLDIVEVDNSVITPISLNLSMGFSPNANGTFDLINDPGGIWTGALTVDLDAALDAKNIAYTLGATRVMVVFDNTLKAQSESGTQAHIAKKDAKGLSITVVPEPTSIALALLGLFGLVARFRKFNNQ